MSRCAYCRRELPGLETLCQQCFENGYDGLVHPKPWSYRLRPRLTRGNLVGFFILFVFSFVLFRFDFPDFRARHMKTTETSSLISILIACVAFFYESKGKSESVILPRRNFETRSILGRLMLLVAVELIVGLFLYFMPMAVLVIFAFVGLVIVQNDIFDPIRTKSLGSLLCAITAVPATFCFIAWRITDQDVWLRFMLVGQSLMAALIFLDRRRATE